MNQRRRQPVHQQPLQWRHNGHDSVSNHQPRHCLLYRLFERGSKKTSKLRVTGLCEGNSPGTGEFPAQMASNAENVSIWWRHHALWYSSDYTGIFRVQHQAVISSLQFWFAHDLTLNVMSGLVGDSNHHVSMNNPTRSFLFVFVLIRSQSVSNRELWLQFLPC